MGFLLNLILKITCHSFVNSLFGLISKINNNNFALYFQHFSSALRDCSFTGFVFDFFLVDTVLKIVFFYGSTLARLLFGSFLAGFAFQEFHSFSSALAALGLIWCRILWCQYLIFFPPFNKFSLPSVSSGLPGFYEGFSDFVLLNVHPFWAYQSS